MSFFRFACDCDEDNTNGGVSLTTRFMGSLALIFGLAATVVPASETLASTNKTIICGYVRDAETGDPLPYAAMTLFRLASPVDTLGTNAGGIWTKESGYYQLATTPGLYDLQASYVSYETAHERGIRVAQDTLFVDFELAPSDMQITPTVEVVGDRLKNTEGAILVQQEKAAAISDGISEEQIKRSTDGNAAEVARRITGLTVVDGKFAFVRGMGQRYTTAQINGATVSSPEPNRKVLPLDVFASGLLENVVVLKTYTPDQPGEFAGGTVNIKTKDFPGRDFLGFSASIGGRDGSTGEPFRTYEGGKRDWLGFDDGTRSIPKIIKEVAADQRVGEWLSPEAREELGEAFNKTWVPEGTSADPAYSFGLSGGAEVDVLGRPLGVMVSGSLSNSYKHTQHDERTFFLGEENGEPILRTRADYDVDTSTREVLWGSLANVNFGLSDYTLLRLRGMYNRSAEDEVREYEGYNEDIDAQYANTRMKYVERGVFTGSAEFDHRLPFWQGARFTWRYHRSAAERNEPDNREWSYYLFDRRVIQFWRLNDKDTNLIRLFGETTDDEETVEGHMEFPISFLGGGDNPPKLRGGFLEKTKERRTGYRRFLFRFPDGQSPLFFATTVDSLMTDEYIGPTGFRLDESTQDTDAYEGEQELKAQYAMLDLPFAGRFRLVGGVRWEDSKQTVRTDSPFGRDIIAARDGLLHTKDALPGVNVTMKLMDHMNVRLAYSRTLARPDLREMSTIIFTDYRSGYAQTGNPDLQRTEIESYDVRWEFYPGFTELLAVSGFYKEFTNPIEYIVVGGQDPLYMPVNGDGGKLRGVEFETRLGLGRFTPWLYEFGINANVSLIHSETTIDPKTGVQTSSERPLNGQSPYILNLGLMYRGPDGKTSAGLLYNVFGERLDSVGAFGIPDIYEQPTQSLDFKASLGGGFIKVAFENLLDDKVEFHQGDKKTYERRVGRSASLGISYTLDRQ